RSRSSARAVEHDPLHGLVKLNPLLSWSAADVGAYVRTHDGPTKPLHARGYPSIGCAPCASPVAVGEDPRSGRWRAHEKKECGLHARSVPKGAFIMSTPTASAAATLVA